MLLYTTRLKNTLLSKKTGKVLKSNTLIFRQAKPVTQNQKTHNLTCYSPRLIKMIMEEVYITPSTIGPRLLNPSNYKTGYSIPCIFQNQPNNPLRWFWRVVLSFSFLFIAAESLKNHNKSQKNPKNCKSNFVGLYMSRST